MSQPFRLSKSRFMSGHQCDLRLWNDFYHADLATPPDAGNQARFDAGNEVGELARRRFPGVLVEADHRHPEEALAETARVLSDPTVQTLHEAAFQHQGAFARVDVLARRNGAWDVVEVKSVLEAKGVHVLDTIFQRWIVAGTGLPVGSASVMVLDRDYQYEGGELDLTGLFRLVDVSGEAEFLVPTIESDLAHFQALLRHSESPEVLPGPQCLDPYECPYLDHCTRHWPEVPDPVDWVPGLGATKAMSLHAEGIHGMSELPLDHLNSRQVQVVACHREDRAWVDEDLKNALQAFEFPIRFLDFETFATPIPRLARSRPYEAVPVQWSCHTLNIDGSLTHDEFLADGPQDPREAFAASLLEALGAAGSICVYSSYEKSTLTRLAGALPHRAPEVQAVVGRLVDLLTIVRDHVYLPAFQGSYSIKSVLPALVPGFGYGHLQVQDGQQAGEAFGRMIAEPDPQLRQVLRADLLAYCAQDTMAMVKVLEALETL